MSRTSSETPQHLILLASIDGELVKQLGIPNEPLESPLEARSLNGLKLFQVLDIVVPVFLILSGNNS